MYWQEARKHEILKRQACSISHPLQHINLAISHSSLVLEDRDSSRWTADTSLDMQRRRSQEERPSVILLTRLGKSFQIPHLANGCAPLNEEPFVKTPSSLHWRWPCCKKEKKDCQRESTKWKTKVKKTPFRLLSFSKGPQEVYRRHQDVDIPSKATVSPPTALKCWS